MKFGMVAIAYFFMVVLAANHRLVNLMTYLGVALLATVAITLIGLFFHSDGTVTFGARWSKKILVVLAFAAVALFTWKGLLGIIF